MSTPAPLRVAAAAVGAEGVAGVVAAVAFVIADLVSRPADLATALTLSGLLLVLGGGLLLIARGLLQQRPSAQTPAYLAQFFALVVAYYQRHTLIAVTIVLALVALVTVAALSAPESRQALRRD